MRPVLFTGDIFRHQPRGGITRYFVEVMNRLERPVRVVAGVHQSASLDQVAVPVAAAARMPTFKGSPRVRALANAVVDRLCLRAPNGAIIHPTYYRDPATLPAGPLVVTVFDMAHERLSGSFARRWWNAPDPAAYKRALCERADRIVCISEATRCDLAELIPRAAARARVIHCGVTDWQSIEPEPLAGFDAPFLLWVGERRGYKNFLATLAAWAATAAARDTRLLCVGGGAFNAEERAAAAACGVSPRLIQRALGDRQLRWAYEHATALLYTSRWEGFGLPMLEAMSLGCPVVASDLAALREVAADAAHYVDPGERDSLCAGITRCLERGRAADDAKLRARAATFSWERCAADHERLYRGLD